MSKKFKKKIIQGVSGVNDKISEADAGSYAIFVDSSHRPYSN